MRNPRATYIVPRRDDTHEQQNKAQKPQQATQRTKQAENVDDIQMKGHQNVPTATDEVAESPEEIDTATFVVGTDKPGMLTNYEPNDNIWKYCDLRI